MKKTNINERIELSRMCIADFKKAHGRLPTITEYDANYGQGMCRRMLSQHTGKSWNKIISEWFPQDELHLRHYTVEEFRQAIINFYKSFDGVPTYSDLQAGGLPSFSVVKRLTGKTYREFLRDLGYSMKGTTTAAKTQDIMLAEARKRFEECGKLPPEKDDGTGIKTMASYRKYFGSLTEICKRIGLDYSKVEKANGAFGTLCVDAAGNICNSIIEMQIDNFFINEQISFRKEVPYSEIIPGCRFIFDWAIEWRGRTWYVEYFGLYDAESGNSMIKKYTQKADNKMETLRKSGKQENCFFIFPADVANKSTSEIFAQILSK